MLVADPAVEVELQSLALPQEGHRLTAPGVVQPVFAEENGGDGRRLVGCRLDRRDCHGCFASCSCPGGCRLTAGLLGKGHSMADRRSTHCFLYPQRSDRGQTDKNRSRPPWKYCPGGDQTRQGQTLYRLSAAWDNAQPRPGCSLSTTQPASIATGSVKSGSHQPMCSRISAFGVAASRCAEVSVKRCEDTGCCQAWQNAAARRNSVGPPIRWRSGISTSAARASRWRFMPALP